MLFRYNGVQPIAGIAFRRTDRAKVKKARAVVFATALASGCFY